LKPEWWCTPLVQVPGERKPVIRGDDDDDDDDDDRLNFRTRL
jgi:hypothetical protein